MTADAELVRVYLPATIRSLNPLRAKVSLGMRVLTVTDVGFDHRAGSLYLAHHRRKEELAAKVAAGAMSTLGIEGLT